MPDNVDHMVGCDDADKKMEWDIELTPPQPEQTTLGGGQAAFPLSPQIRRRTTPRFLLLNSLLRKRDQALWPLLPQNL